MTTVLSVLSVACFAASWVFTYQYGSFASLYRAESIIDLRPVRDLRRASRLYLACSVISGVCGVVLVVACHLTGEMQ
jgi:hypothetical protein